MTSAWFGPHIAQCPWTHPHPLKQKCRHFDEIFITGCTGSCHFDNFHCSQWWTFHQNEDFSVSVSHWTRGHLKEILDKYFKANSCDWWVRYPLWNCSHVNGTGTHWWIVKIGSGNGLVPSGNKSLILVNIDPDLCRHMASLGHNEIKLALPSQWPTFMITTSLKWLVRSTIDRREMNSLTATFYPSWWRHQMETFFSLLAGPLWGESTGHRWIPPTKQVTQSVDVLFDLRKRLSKQSRRQWFKTPLHSLWRHCKGYWFSALCIPVANINFNP